MVISSAMKKNDHEVQYSTQDLGTTEVGSGLRGLSWQVARPTTNIHDKYTHIHLLTWHEHK